MVTDSPVAADSSRRGQGIVLAGRYRLDGTIAEGGMGCVYVARDQALDRRVAVKTVRTDLNLAGEIADRFTTEARALARLRGPHVAHILDVGRAQSGTPFMVLEYLEGEDLHEIVTERGPLAVDVAVDVILQACEGLAEAHAFGIIHRDLKPDNLFLANTIDGHSVVKVIDFGIAKLAGPGARNITNPNSKMGSPHFMAPEQFTDPSNVDYRADIWSLGATLCFLLTGKLPFAAPTLREVFAQVLTGAPPDLEAERPDLPYQLVGAVRRCLIKHPEGRFDSVAELAQALSPFAEGTSSAERCREILEGSGIPVSHGSPRLASRKDEEVDTTLRAPRSRWRVSASVAAAVAALGVGGSLPLAVQDPDLEDRLETVESAALRFFGVALLPTEELRSVWSAPQSVPPALLWPRAHFPRLCSAGVCAGAVREVQAVLSSEAPTELAVRARQYLEQPIPGSAMGPRVSRRHLLPKSVSHPHPISAPDDGPHPNGGPDADGPPLHWW